MPIISTQIDTNELVSLTKGCNYILIEGIESVQVYSQKLDQIALVKIKDCQPQSAVVSPDGRYLIIMHKSGTDRCIFDTTKNILPPKFMSFKNRIFHASYLSQDVQYSVKHEQYFDAQFIDNDRVVTVVGTGEILVWSLNAQRLLWVVGASSHDIDSIQIAHNKKTIVLSEHLMDLSARVSDLAKIGLYNTRSKRIFFHNVGEEFPWQHSRSVGQYGCSEELATGYYLRLWNLHSGELLQTFETDKPVENLRFGNSDALLAGSEMDTTETIPRTLRYTLLNTSIWNVETGQKIQTLPDLAKPIGFTQDDRYLVVQSEDNQIRFWDVQNESWHDSYQFEGVITSAQMTDSDTVIALEKRGKPDDLPEWYIHQITLD